MLPLLLLYPGESSATEARGLKILEIYVRLGDCTSMSYDF